MIPIRQHLISEESQAAIRLHLKQHARFSDEAEFEALFQGLLRLVDLEVASVVSEERQCWFLKRIGTPCRQ
jgi:hypothetical protein